MYSVILTNGKIINVIGDDYLFCEKTRTMRIFNKNKEIARINIDNIVGIIQHNNIHLILN
jgi:hypothetical protein